MILMRKRYDTAIAPKAPARINESILMYSVATSQKEGLTGRD
jgi:hypothetical protein